MGLDTIESFLTSLALKGDKVGARYSWRLGKWMRGVATVTNETISWMSRRLGRSGVDVDVVRAAGLLKPKVELGYPFLSTSSDRVSRRAEELLNGVCVLDNGASLKLEAISWRQDPFNGVISTERFLFNALDWVRELVGAYRMTEDVGYLDRAKGLTARWIAECLYRERPERLWDDHIAALRAIVLCQLWSVCRPGEPAESPFLRDLLSAIFRHAGKLAHRRFYRAEHNHGVTQAYALMAIGLLFPLHPKAQSWVELGRSRLQQQMEDNVSREGLHREHSPYYHFFVLRQFLDAHELAQAYGVGFSQRFTERLEKMLISGVHFLKPNGLLPALGDTSVSSPILIEEKELVGRSPRSGDMCGSGVTKWLEGTPSETQSALFTDGGYALLRGGCRNYDNSRDEIYLAFRLSTFRTSHIHRDIFSFELYGYGDDLIVDSGGPYQYGHPSRNGYFLSSRAHNTVVVDGGDQEVGEARVLRWSTSPACDIIDAEHTNYPGVIHRRALVFVRPRYFILFDWLVSGRSHKYSQLFHLNPNLQATLKGFSVVTENSTGGPTVQIVPLIEEGLEVSLQEGIADPMQGWVCVGERQMIRNSVVNYHRSGTAVGFVVLIIPEPPGKHSRIEATLEGRPFQEESVIQIFMNGRHDRIFFPPSGNITVEQVQA